jgi:hypothetical protein
MHERLRFESARTRVSMSEIISAALDERLPKDIKIVVGKEKR